MIGKIFIKDLLLRCTIGINEEEKATKQDEIVNLTVWVDFDKALETDNIDETVNYSTIYEKILLLVENEKFDLQETFAKKIADICLENKRVIKVKVSCEKPYIHKYLKSAGVEIKIER